MNKNLTKLTSLCTLILCFALTLSGCGETALRDDSTFRFKVKGEEPITATVAEQDSYSLVYDAERGAIMLKYGEAAIFGSVPAKEYANPELSGRMLSNIGTPIAIEYVNGETKKLERLDSITGCAENGRILCEEIKNGIRINYCFDEVNIVVPVEYTLKGDYVEASVKTKNIKESNTLLYSVSLLPGLVSCENGEGSYIFLPDGTGAIYSCSPASAEHTYWIPVYGSDPSSLDLIKYRNTATARLPVFGVQGAKSAVFAIITGGSECAEINATTSAPGSGYSNAYATFVLRGKTEVSISGMWGRAVVIPTYSADMTVSQTLSVRYYHLTGEKSGYMQMADCYRDYLIDKYSLKQTESDKQLYMNLVMAATQRRFFFGIPSDKTNAITTYKQAQTILSDFEDTSVAVRLDGIQRGGIEIGKYAGGFKLEKTVGSQNELSALLEYADKNGVAIYPNIDLVRYRKGINGYDIPVRSASSAKSLQYFYNIAKNNEDSSSYIYYLMNPLLHITATARATEAVSGYGFKGISLDTLSNMCYGDYKQQSTYVARGFANRVNKIFKTTGKKLSVMGEAANDYAAVMCDDIIASPTKSSDYNGQTHRIPFYQIVFKGYIPLSGEAVNLSNQPKRELLLDASLGIGTLFSVANDDTVGYNLSFFSQLSGGSYYQIDDRIKAAVENNRDAFDAAKNQTITDYEILADGVTKTTFSGGKAIIANFTDEQMSIGDMAVDANGYIITEGGAR